MPADDAVNGSQPKAAAGELGGEEGIENLSPDFLLHAAAGVGDLQKHVAPFRHALTQQDILQAVPVVVDAPGADGDGAAVFPYGF